MQADPALSQGVAVADPMRDQRTRIASLVEQNGGPHRAPAVPHLDVQRFPWAGREYYMVNGGVVYPVPIDEPERERLDMIHCLIHDRALFGRFYNADIPPLPRGQQRRPRALDVGCGTAIWVYDMASANPTWDVLGIDLFCDKPRNDEDVPNAHVHTPIDFNAAAWPFREGEFDLIRNAGLNGSVMDWFSHLRKCFFYLRSGGFVEYIDIDWTPQFPQTFTPPPTVRPVQIWWSTLQEASARFQRPIEYPANMDALLENNGFIDPTHRTIRVQLQYGEGGNEEDDERTEVLIERMCRAAMFQLDGNARARELEGLSMYLLTQLLQWSENDVRRLCRDVQRVCNSKGLPMYFNLHIWTARKP